MENKKPWNYRLFMSFVDIFLWIRSLSFMLIGFYLFGFLYSWTCQPIDYSDTQIGNFIVDIGHYFILSQLIYMMQSVVFVTCQRNKSVGTYLLIHHIIFPLGTWLVLNMYPGGIHISLDLWIPWSTSLASQWDYMQLYTIMALLQKLLKLLMSIRMWVKFVKN